jgi:hypothetical protein
MFAQSLYLLLMQDGTFGHRKYNLAKADFV